MKTNNLKNSENIYAKASIPIFKLNPYYRTKDEFLLRVSFERFEKNCSNALKNFGEMFNDFKPLRYKKHPKYNAYELSFGKKISYRWVL